MFSLKRLLEQNGHDVAIFSMHHPRNYESKYSKYFVSYINYDEEIKNVSMSSALKVFNRTIYSKEAAEKIEELIRLEKPDIAHLQNIHHHITPSILPVLNKYNIPIIWTLHDYSLICPNTTYLSHGKICEKCKHNKFYWPSIEKCKKNSFSASTMAGFEATAHKIRKSYEIVDFYIAPSEFIRNKFVEYSVDKNKIKRIDHFTNFRCDCEVTTKGDYYLYVGRISEEKGIKTLMDAAIKVNSSKLKIAGGGPLQNEMINYVKSRDKNNIIEFLGHQSQEQLVELYANCKFIVVPSEWYEIAGLIILEAFSCGKPAIGSDIGGIPELIKDTERGFIYKTGDVEDLSAAIKYLLNNPDLVAEMGHNARQFIENEMSPDMHYKKLIEIYDLAIISKKIRN
jgi:glycosyltransferase involved in cell wall biosynthesis